jgi:acylphosphatase
MTSVIFRWHRRLSGVNGAAGRSLPKPAGRALAIRKRMQMKTVQLRVLGRVQGVGYRAWAIETATRLGLRGWVRNRADRSVELLATGPTEAVAAMVKACRKGPPAARVDRVEFVEVQNDDSAGFAACPDL